MKRFKVSGVATVTGKYEGYILAESEEAISELLAQGIEDFDVDIMDISVDDIKEINILQAEESTIEDF